MVTPTPEDRDRSAARARKQRRIATLILGTFALWVFVQFMAGQLGWPVRLVALIDLAALALLGVGLWMAWGLLRAPKE